MTVVGVDNLVSTLKKQLKVNEGEYYILNTFTTKKCVPVVHKPKQDRPILSTKTTHFCTLFSPTKAPLLAVEVFSYLTIYKDKVEKLVYVSKADTTGLDITRCVNVGGFITELMKSICAIPLATLLGDLKVAFDDHKQVEKKNVVEDNIFVSETQFKLHVLEKRTAGDSEYHAAYTSNKVTALEYLALNGISEDVFAKQKVDVKLVLFTRSEGQYLFPESAKNSGKHVLDGNQLLKWWLKNTDKITSLWKDCQRYLNILNFDAREIERYLTNLTSDWKPGNVYDSATNINNPAIFDIPLLPDDPKGRFLEHLVVEGRAKNVLHNRYWEELTVRQEFRFGAIVGLIGVEGNVNQLDDVSHQRIKPSEMKQLTEAVTSKDYSDQSDWSLLFPEIQQLSFLNVSSIIGESSNFMKRKPETNETNETIPTVKVNTLLCVRKKVKK